MKGGSVTGIPVVCWCPPLRLSCGRVEWRGVVCAVMPRVQIGGWHLALSRSSFALSRSSFALSCFSRIVLPFTVFAVIALLVWGGVFVTGWCYCGMAVMVYACVGMAVV